MFINKFNKDLIAGFKKYQDLECIEITTSGATHGFSPLLATDTNLNAQFKVGSDTTKKFFGKKQKAAGCLNVHTDKGMNLQEKTARKNGVLLLK